MSVTPGQAALIRSSYNSIGVESEALLDAIYAILFVSKPELGERRELLLEEHEPMIFGLTRLIVENLDKITDPHRIVETIESHDVEYAMPDEYYELVTDAVLQGLAAQWKGHFTDEVRASWASALADLVSFVKVDVVSRPAAPRQTQPSNARTLAHAPDQYLAMFLPEDDLDGPDSIDEDVPEPGELPALIDIEYEGVGVLPAAPLQTILDISIQNRVPHIHECGSRAKCSTCRVQILDGLDNCMPRNHQEATLARRKNFPPDIRLACQTRITGPTKLRRLVFDRKDVHQAVWDDEHSIGREMNLAVLFADIRSFTPFTESNLAYDVVHILNRYFDAIGDPIHENHGYINKYIGDGIMVLFGLNPRRDTSPCVDAVRASLGILEQLDDVNEYLTEHFSHRFDIGIGIHYGPVIIGEIGFRLKKEFTAMGDTVNAASRIESETKVFGTSLLVSDEVRQAVPSDVCRFGQTHEISIRGKTGRYKVHEIVEQPG